MRTRNGLDWTEDFAAIAEAARELENCILDGEVVALDHNGAPDFAALQAVLSDGQSKDWSYFVFDVLHAAALATAQGALLNQSRAAVSYPCVAYRSPRR